jgi:formylglycine-generating enzyme required for sulfatase activity
LRQEDTTELLERLKRLLAEDPTLAARLATITGDGNVVGDHNVATVNKLSAGDYAIQIGQLHLTLSPDQLRSLPVSAYSASPLPAASTGLPRRLRVFLCHASGDKPAVRDLYRRLRSDGIAPWLAEEDLLPGQDWQLEIPKAVRSSDAVVICLSRRAITKAGYVQKEIKYALDVADEQPEGTIFLIPLRLEECEVPERLRRWQWVDFFQEKGYERLLRALRARAESLGLGRHPSEPEMVLIPAGEFLMGSDPGRDKDAFDEDEEQPQHTLYLPDYYLARTPVTNAQYAAFVQATYRDPPEHWEGGKPPEGKEDHPVVYVSWYDAVAYCNWLSQVTGRPYRLPSEAEWEKGARGTDGRIYPWGDEPPDERLCNLGNDVSETTPVGRYSPQGDSPYGCADMAGNVWEWTRSLHRYYPYDPGDGREDLEAGRDAPRGLRGGTFGGGDWGVRCAARGWDAPYVRAGDYGFRLVASPAHL